MSLRRSTILLLAIAFLPLICTAQTDDADDNTFYFAPLQWNFDIPQYYYEDSTISPVATIQDSAISPILLITKGTRNQLYVRMVPVEIYNQQVGGYKAFWDKFTQVLYKQATDFGDKPDTIQTPITIDGYTFTRFEMTTKENGNVVDYFAIYATVIDGKDFVTEILTNNGDDIITLTNAWKKSIAGMKKGK